MKYFLTFVTSYIILTILHLAIYNPVTLEEKFLIKIFTVCFAGFGTLILLIFDLGKNFKREK